MGKKETQHQVDSMILKILTNSYIWIENIEEETNFFEIELKKLKYLGVDTKPMEDLSDKDKSRLHIYGSDRYSAWVIQGISLKYLISNSNSSCRDERELSKKFNKISLNLIDYLIKYKKMEVSIDDLLNFISKNRKNEKMVE